MPNEIGLADAAQRLGQTWAQTWTQVLRGELSARKLRGRWVVDVESVERLRERAHETTAA